MKRSHKEVVKIYRGLCIVKNSAYTYGYKSYKVMLLTPDIERYFKTIGQARQYVDSHYDDIQKELNRDFSADDIPF